MSIFIFFCVIWACISVPLVLRKEPVAASIGLGFVVSLVATLSFFAPWNDPTDSIFDRLELFVGLSIFVGIISIIVVSLYKLGTRPSRSERLKREAAAARQVAMNAKGQIIQSLVAGSSLPGSMVWADAQLGLAIDQDARVIRTVDLSAGLTPVTHPFSHVISCQLLEGGIVVSTTNRSAQLVNAAKGGLALGVVGALAGGLSTPSQTSSIRGLDVLIIFDDPSHASHVLRFMGESGRMEAQRLYALVQGIIRQYQSGQPVAASVQSPSFSPTSVVDELQKLANLRNANVLTEQEFQEQKRLLLARSRSTGPVQG